MKDFTKIKMNFNMLNELSQAEWLVNLSFCFTLQEVRDFDEDEISMFRN